MFGLKLEKKKEVTLDDVIPAHPDEYPGKGLRALLESRREWLHDVHAYSHSEVLVDSGLGMVD